MSKVGTSLPSITTNCSGGVIYPDLPKKQEE